MNDGMESLTVFYDPACGLCRRFRLWLLDQALWLPVEFMGFDEPEAGERFPGIRELEAEKECVVMSDRGEWWQGADSWLVCLWATREYRLWSRRLAAPMFRPVLHQVVHLISSNRLKLSRLMGLQSDRELVAELQEESSGCEDGACEASAWRVNLSKKGGVA